MIKTSISLQDLRRKIYLKAKADKTWRENAVASAGTDGVGLGCMKLLVSTMTTKFVTIRRESAGGPIGRINFQMKSTD